MGNKKLTKIMAGIGIASLVVGMSVSANAGTGKNSCGKGSCGKGGAKKGFFQCLYDACKGCPQGDKAKSSCGKRMKKSSKAKSSCGKGSCGK